MISETPPSAAEYLYRRIGRNDGITYAMQRTGGESIRGAGFWESVVEILRRSRPVEQHLPKKPAND